ncbi:MAG: ATPase domain-containing protein [Candidatus Aenigmatarchaeota archaeon]
MRLTTGLASLDKLIDGGFPSKTAILLSGGPGTGKTLLGLNFLLEGAAKGEKCYYLSVSESKEELLRACEEINSLKKAKNYIGKNLLIETVRLGEKVDLNHFTRSFASYPNINRLVIDNVNKLLILAKNSREYRIMLSEILNYLREKVDCSLLICETNDSEIDTGNGEAFDCDGVLHTSFLDLEEEPKRTLQIYKLRYTSFEPRVRHELLISSKDIRLTSTKVI